jgi:nicotinamidase-related amidase
MKEVYGKLVREGLEEVLEPDVCAVLSVDMQNDAMHPDGKIRTAGNDISGMLEILPRCSRFLAEARALGVLVVHVQTITLRDGRSDSPSWIRAKGGIVNEGEFFLEGTWGAEFSPEVAPIAGEPVVTKHRSSAFHGTDLELILRGNGVETVVVIGEQTPGCIEATYRDAAYHDFYNVLVEDCVAAFDPELHEASLKIQRARHDVCTAEDVLSVWRRARGEVPSRTVSGAAGA